MANHSSRREFLQNVSLAGAALVAGGGALSTAGCTPKVEVQMQTQTLDQVEIDENGCLLVKDKDIAAKLDAILAQQTKPDSGTRKGICVTWRQDDPEGNKVNSLCNC